MYIVKDYLTNDIVAMCSREEDAMAMVRSSKNPSDPKLIVEKE